MTTARLQAPLPLVLLLAGAAGAVVAAVPTAGLLPLLGLAVGVVLLLGMVRWPWALIYFVVLTSALSGLLRGAGADVAGGLSASGVRWVAVAGMLGAIGLVRARQVRLPTALVPWTVFSAWCAFWWLITGAERSGLKDVAFYALPVGIAVVAVAVFEDDPVRSREHLDRLLMASLAVPFAIYAITIPLGLVDLTSNGPKGILGPRPVATHALVILCVALPRWRYRLAGWRVARIVSMLVLGLVLFTLSRLALAAAPLLLLIGIMKPARLAGATLRLTLAGAVALLLLFSLPGVRDRMFVRPPESLDEVPETLNVSGRDVLWSTTLAQWREHPWFGLGPGRLRPALAESKDWPSFDIPPQEYPPHNEYLQALHDEGVVGLGLLLLALATPLLWHYRRWSVAEGRDAGLASAHLAVVLGMVVIIVNSLADNTLHYTTVTGPVFLLIASAYCLQPHKGRESDV